MKEASLTEYDATNTKQKKIITKRLASHVFYKIQKPWTYGT